MNTSEYQKLAERTECDQQVSRCRLGGMIVMSNLPPHVQDITLPARLNQGANGLASEAGEILGLLEKWIYFGQPLNYVKMVDELGDALWYIAQLCNALRMDMADVMEANINKLRTRFPEKFTYRDALEENRDRAAEMKSVEGVVNQEGIMTGEDRHLMMQRNFERLVENRKRVGMPLDLSHKWEGNYSSEVYRCRVCGAYSNMGSGHLPCPKNEDGSLRREPLTEKELNITQVESDIKETLKKMKDDLS